MKRGSQLAGPDFSLLSAKNPAQTVFICQKEGCFFAAVCQVCYDVCLAAVCQNGGNAKACRFFCRLQFSFNSACSERVCGSDGNLPAKFVYAVYGFDYFCLGIGLGVVGVNAVNVAEKNEQVCALENCRLRTQVVVVADTEFFY